MRIIFQIAKNELRNLFYSPIAWFVTVVMMVMCAFYFTETTSFTAKVFHLNYKNNPDASLSFFDSMTHGLYLNISHGFIITILPHLFLFVPLLTMGVIGREFNNGTIRLLYSSPVKLRTLVLGKFLGMAIYNLLLVSVVGIFMVAGFAGIQSLDVPPLLCASLGLYLFFTALTAIGIFMSSLTTYQVVSAISTFIVLFILSNIGSLWQQYDFVRDLTLFLSLRGRLEKMILGLLTSKDVLYYLIIMAMFIGFTLLKLKAGQETKPWYLKMSRYMAIVVGALVIGYISARPVFTGYLDTTATKTNTLHPRTQQLLKRLNEAPLEVTLYTNIFASNASFGFPRERNNYITQLWEGYQRFKTDIDFKYEYYYALTKNQETIFDVYPGKSLQQIVGVISKMNRVDSAMFKPYEKISKEIDLALEDYQVVMQLKYKGRSTLVRFYNDSRTLPDQQNMNAAFSRLLEDPIPNLYFVTGALERNIHKKGEREYFTHVLDKSNRYALINTGFDADSLNLSTQPIPDSTSLLVMADPKMDLTPTVLNKLQTHINTGGNMLVLGEPGKQYVLNPLLSQTGVQFSNGQLVQPSRDETPDKITNYYTFDAFDLAEHTELVKRKYIWKHGSRKDSLRNGFEGATGIPWSDSSSFTVKPLYMTSPGRAWLKAGKLVIDSITPVFNPQEGDIKSNSFATAIALSRQHNNKEQRIIIAGDADFLSNFRQMNNLIDPLYSWLSYNRFPVYTPYPRAPDTVFLLSPTAADVQKMLLLWILPAVVLVTGTVILIRRKRK
ncbi:ABC transporter permease subunit [Pseudobacter ginsenosidimutans]|uniref:ABC-2 type transport system permease protein n=1 Tax=Pseudobacter ginsenosidimutans TaxID=661488 RepID=A0A4Q7N309_9BACT|nr:Gldg family protein [Pseudobacter ginsenosidimutans]QEC44007.1 ABC transporter permease subunit [Pseudobacter ginsenosidimutans]RZS75444.1 ABC-2 type transport system permease protein [Pseudobacter ginsenosidimutans]